MTDRTAEEILDDLNEFGTPPTPEEIVALCDAAAAGDHATQRYDALEHALDRAGWAIIDTTTDDDDGTVLELVPPGPDA